MSKLLEDKSILITGSGRGIGKALALGLADHGASIILTSRTQQEIDETKKLIEEKGQNAIAITSDVAKYEQIKDVISKGIQEYGQIDVLINNAGFSKIKPIHRLRVKEFQDMINTNITGVYNGTHAVISHMKERKKGCILNTGSMAVDMALAGWSVYAMTKGALIPFTNCLAEELKREKIRVNTIMPNMVHTPMLHAGRTQEQIEALNAIQPEALVPYYAFLASDKAKRITGQNINVDAMERVLKFREQLPEDKQKDASWSDIDDIVKENMKYEHYKVARKCKKLIRYLLAK
ncbi:MAG: SDR family NAD(P)-dependent oxidoreductase [Candidatus Lokiarchaeota archaeon]|nr:SDR family NAD(P)-dependent oxidoreductase [Candidatus Lokiarchaeota archaeon]